MRISEVLKTQKRTVSLELFPPKQFSMLENTSKIVSAVAALSPSFISCTYGATGGTSEFTVEVAKKILAEGVPALAHLTCVSSGREKVLSVIGSLKESGVENILALRGDIPNDPDFTPPGVYKYASELIREIRANGDFCIGGACNPEGHPESASLDEDIAHLAEKVKCGAEFLTSQMFFDNAVFYSFLEKARAAGINVPVLAGIMPVTDASKLGKMIQLSKSRVPASLAAVINRYGGTPDMLEAGIEFSASQIRELQEHGINNIHIYTMNRPEIAAAIMSRIYR